MRGRIADLAVLGQDVVRRTRTVKVLHKHCADVGRDPSEISLSMQHPCEVDPEASAAKIEEFVSAGADHVILYFADNRDRKLLGQTVDAVVRRVGLES